jgi:hypothetical protein
MSHKNSFTGSIKELTRLVETAVEVSKTSKKKSIIIEAYASAFTQVEKVVESIPKKVSTFSTTKKSLRVVNNLLGGTLDGLYSSDISLSQLRSLSKDLISNKMPLLLESVSSDSANYEAKYGQKTEAFVQKPKSFDLITESLITELNKPATDLKSSLSGNQAFKQALLDAVKNATKGNSEHIPPTDTPVGEPELPTNVRDAETKQVLNGLQSKRALLPATLNDRGFTMLRLPVAPIFHATDRSGGVRAVGLGMGVRGQPNPYYTLKAAGIRSVAVGEYVIIDDQIMLAISKGSLQTRKDEEDAQLVKSGLAKGSRALRAKSAKLQSPIEYARTIISIIADTTGTTYELVDEIPATNPKNPDIVFFWIMPSKTLTFLLRKNFPKIRHWGLGF